MSSPSYVDNGAVVGGGGGASLPPASAANELLRSTGAGDDYEAVSQTDVLAESLADVIGGEVVGTSIISDGAGDVDITSPNVSAFLAAADAASARTALGAVGTVDLTDAIERTEQKISVYSAETVGNVTPSGAQTVGGVSVPDGQRVLLTAQSDPAQNRVWTTNDGGGWFSTTDTQDSTKMLTGSHVYCQRGSNAGMVFYCTTTGSLEFSTPLTWRREVISGVPVGPFILRLIPAGDEVDPADSEPALAGYGGVLTPFRAPSSGGSVISLRVGLSDVAAGSDLIATVFIDDPTTLSVTIPMGQDGAQIVIPPGVVTFDNEGIAVAVQTGLGWTGVTLDLVASIEITR